MESKWRLEPWKLGVEGMGARLMTRVFGVDFYRLTDFPGPPGFAVIWTGNPLDPEYCLKFGVALWPKSAPHFPYGLPVDPD